MKAIPILVVLGFILFLSCSESTDPVDPVTSEPFETQTVRLTYGETVTIEPDLLTLKFDNLLYDSRCALDINCFWEGQARVSVLMSHPDRGSMIVTPAKRGRDTLYVTELSEVGLGYRVELMYVEPYPMYHDSPADVSEYVIKIRVSSADDAPTVYPPVIGTTLPPDSLQIDDYQLDSLSLDGDILTAHLHYSGGCNLHTYDLYWIPNSFLESQPPQVNLYLIHNGYDDACDAIIGDTSSFDVTAIKSAFIGIYGSPGEVQLNVYGYFEDEPGDRVSIMYEIE